MTEGQWVVKLINPRKSIDGQCSLVCPEINSFIELISNAENRLHLNSFLQLHKGVIKLFIIGMCIHGLSEQFLSIQVNWILSQPAMFWIVVSSFVQSAQPVGEVLSFCNLLLDVKPNRFTLGVRTISSMGHTHRYLFNPL